MVCPPYLPGPIILVISEDYSPGVELLGLALPSDKLTRSLTSIANREVDYPFG
jgi:hypothetical protein